MSGAVIEVVVGPTPVIEVVVGGIVTDAARLTGTIDNLRLPVTAQAATLAATYAARSTTAISLWGDSTTAAMSGYGDSLALAIAPLTVNNFGVGGDTSRQIAARQGGNSWLMWVNGGAIPASGGVIVSVAYPSGVLPQIADGTGSMAGTLFGVHGTITYTGGVYTFTRDIPGTAVTFPRWAMFRTDDGENARRDVQVLQAGINNRQDTVQISGDISAMVLNVGGDRRVLVNGVLTGNHFTSTELSGCLALNVANAQKYGSGFFDISDYLVHYGMQDAGLTPGGFDNMQTAQGIVPCSLRDGVIHHSTRGKVVLGNAIARRLYELGWVSTFTSLAIPASTRQIFEAMFERDLEGWVPTGSNTVSRDTSVRYTWEAASMKVTYAAANTHVTTSETMLQPVTVGKLLTVSGRINAPVGFGAMVVIAWFNASGVWVQQSNAFSIDGNGDWQYGSATVTPNAAATQCSVRLYKYTPYQALTGSLWLTDLTVVQGT